MKRNWRQVAYSILLATLLPLATYEFLQKGSENLGLERGWWNLSQRAEDSVRWQTPTGIAPVDHVWHEWQETGRFLVLATQQGRRS